MPLRGPENNGGECPSSTFYWNHQCCCGGNCCWDQCDYDTPPKNCLQEMSGAKWIFRPEKGYYGAFIPGKCFNIFFLEVKIY